MCDTAVDAFGITMMDIARDALVPADCLAQKHQFHFEPEFIFRLNVHSIISLVFQSPLTSQVALLYAMLNEQSKIANKDS